MLLFRGLPRMAPLALICALIVLASCSSMTTQVASSQPSATKSVASPTLPAATPTPTAVTGASATATPTATDIATNNQDIAQLRRINGPTAWIWHTSLPDHRLVVFYGNPLSAVMGPIGAYNDSDLITKLHEQAQAYATLDPLHPVVPALDYVTPVVQPVPMKDNTWVYRMPTASVEHYIKVANDNHALFFFDMQLGHSTVQKEVGLVWQYLQMPGVELALDPEFDLPPGGIPDQVFGRMYASEINWVIDQLSNLVQTQHLPPKILIVHQFLESMLPDWQKIKIKPGVQVVTSIDGFGDPGSKIDDYRMFDHDQLIQYPGMKLFYALDKPLMSPADVLALDPSPLMVMYQ